MSINDLYAQRALVLASALIYWGGVWVQARRVRRHIGRSPNVRPKGRKEVLLWAGWMLVVLAWLLLPFLAGRPGATACLEVRTLLPGPLALALGGALLVAGYAGTLWCYAVMGDTWRMGIDQREPTFLVTRGPYRHVRHPIYSLQAVMLAGVLLLLPTALALVTLLVHLVCVWIKARDEEAYLARVHGGEYRAYLARTGSLFPKIFRAGSRADAGESPGS